ncbi:hydroxyacid dehydrogenase [Candidatus Bathyarchaeota archaeon A05DMB-2]|jgi:D-3-phosphoglycerate dehydrogenase|nr:hydroxyacid dehydrogenase [Candidatus Bathyarchaeota archaeon A05DMB-2]
MTFKVLVCDKIADEGIKLLEEKGYTVTRAWDVPKTELPKLVGEYEALIVRSATKVNEDLINKASKLRVIGRAGEGLDNIDTAKAKERGIAVVNTPHVSYMSVAELTIGHLLALARGIVEGTNSLREGKWKKEELMGVEVNGKTLGIVGCGYIGRTVERIAAALGMRVLGVEECVFDRFIPLHEMLPEADFITIHVPLTPSTRHMISTREFNMMKDGVMIIDCSRGGIVDQEALYQALISGKVKAAAIDVFEEEPPKNSKLLTLKNVIATPHIGAQTHEAQLKASVQIAKKIIEVLEKPAS